MIKTHLLQVGRELKVDTEGLEVNKAMNLLFFSEIYW